MSNGRSVLKRSLPVVLVLLLAVAGAALLVATRPQSPAPRIEEKAWVVDTVPARPAAHVPVIPLYGRLESARASRLTAAIDAEVRAVLVEEGEDVEPGQPLVRLDDRQARLLLEQRQAEVREIRALIDSERHRHDNDLHLLAQERELQRLAQREVERARELKKNRLTAQALIDEKERALLSRNIGLAQRQLAVNDHPARLARLQAQLAKAEAREKQAALDLQRATLTAPFAGRVTRVPASPGNRARPGEVLVELYATEALRVRAQIPTIHLAEVEAALGGDTPPGARARSAEGREVKLRLHRLGGEIGAGRGGRDGLFELLSPPGPIAVGSVLSMKLYLPAREDSLALPREALYGDDRIYTIVDGRLHGHHVRRLGETEAGDGGSRLLLQADDIPPGAPIVVTQLPNAIEGLRVRPRDGRTP